jgi:AraC-like DNA-binding protein
MKPLFIDTGITDSKSVYIKKVDTPYLNKPFHFHPNCELVLVEEGFGKRVVGDSVANFRQDDLVLMGPNVPHIWINDDVFYKGNKQLRSRAVVIYFSPHLLDHLLEPSALTGLRALLNKADRGLEILGKAKAHIRKTLSMIHQKDGLPQLIDFLGILDILSHTKETRFFSGPRFVNTYTEQDVGRINAIYQFLMQNFKQDIQLGEVAAIALMAPTAFCRFFKLRTNKTLSYFLNELRVRHACDLLLNTGKTVAEISYESGYHNMTNFNKFFKGITGLTPSGYRAKFSKPPVPKRGGRRPG